MATTVQIPLQLLTINLADGNSYWGTVDDTNFDWGGIFFASATGATSYWHGIIPKNVAGTPAWNLFVHHNQTSGTGASAVTLTVKALDFANAATLRGATLTTLISSATASVGASATYNITNLASSVGAGSSNFDSLEAVGAGNELIVELTRNGEDASDSANLWVVTELAMQIDVT